MVIALLVTLIPPLMFDGASAGKWIYKGRRCCLIGCPCALVSHARGHYLRAGGGGTAGALIKGGAALEQLGRITQVALIKPVR